LGDAAVLTSEGRSHPVAIEYDDGAHGRHLVDRVVAAVGRVAAEPGDVLVFLPGAGEIRRTAAALAPLAERHRLDVVPLHGDQPLDEQARALRPGPQRRVVLATNVAETALTVEGVTIVIDSGFARTARFDHRTGLDRLRLGAVSRSSATQRAGRAGRLAPGRCIRLWSRAEEAGRRDHDVPEVARVDLARTWLELTAWGLRDPCELAWLDPPPAASVERASRLLGALGARAHDGRLTAIGRRMLAMPVAPRLARMLIEAEDRGARADGALVAALASERDVVRATRAFGGGMADWPPGPSDLLLRMELFADAARAGFSTPACERLGLDVRAVRAVEHTRRQLARTGRVAGRATADTVLRATLAGFPDRVCRRREPGSPRAVMVGGTGVVLAPESVVREAELFVALEVEGGERGTEALVRLASAVERRWLDELFPGSLATTRTVELDRAHGRAVARTVTRYHDLVLEERIRTDLDPSEAAAALARAVHDDPLGLIDTTAEVEDLLARLRFLARWMPELGLPEDPTRLFAAAVAALAGGVRSLAELRRADLAGALTGMLTHPQRRALEREAPSHWRLPTGRRVPIRYSPDGTALASARIQEVFGLATTPRLAGGRTPLVLELLAPSQRPMQTTADLASFWRTTYAEVRAELRGRYPRHPWPEDPTTAEPTSRAKRR
jgi:ATP-dependent helicase HrpB